jgi:hypothetical protein
LLVAGYPRVYKVLSPTVRRVSFTGTWIVWSFCKGHPVLRTLVNRLPENEIDGTAYAVPVLSMRKTLARRTSVQLRALLASVRPIAIHPGRRLDVAPPEKNIPDSRRGWRRATEMYSRLLAARPSIRRRLPDQGRRHKNKRPSGKPPPRAAPGGRCTI